MLKEVGASGQISLGKKYAGQLFDLQTRADGTIVLQPMQVVPAPLAVQEERASYANPSAAGGSDAGDGWRTPERLARRAAAAARSPAEANAAHAQWEEENKEAIEAMNQRMSRIGSMARRIHDWRKTKAQPAAAADGAV
ncbi:type II toxin-antitoxin system CcdA family antitoxin [Acidovorax sp. HDW3]|uniref:type II toxin-antitoxin system CcdA family antitoxin n=1 Tax=Acidovorax sp. HDW3 TaxID=2714923 RepID=UPI00140DBA73|nr:type II toxin-antitoxin system CcdA family antitoxin [Acidovorax sp. HDW3]QIL43417.1 type II toxin-antitoxin system CcdA family antitoxin [Acidovorax sp. HDW3]